tara:strand:- start:699 stop:872 length:174 start_codon:yes stop_codon:yes gene_type:complete
MDALTAQLVDLGMTGLLIGYLIRQNILMSAGIKERQDKYEALLERTISALGELRDKL